MSGQLEIATLIEKRIRELGLSRADLAARLGYRNFAKGMRRIEEVCQGQLVRHSELLARLPYALKIDPKVAYVAEITTRAQIAEAARQAADAQGQEWRAKFKPHAVVLTERSTPSQLTICALVDGESFKFIQLDATEPRGTFIHQALRELNRRLNARRTQVVPFFGAPTGIAVNFDPDRAVRYDLEGHALEILRGAVRMGETRVSVVGKRIPRVFALDQTLLSEPRELFAAQVVVAIFIDRFAKCGSILAMLEPLEIVLPARRQFKPRAFSNQWALEAACRLDTASPGFLSHVIYASDLKRQVIFTRLAEMQTPSPENPVTLRNMARALVVSNPRDIVRAHFNEVPDGLLGTLTRLGPSPLPEPELYRELFRLFADPNNRDRASLLRQTRGGISERKVAIALKLDPIFVHQHVFDTLQTVGHVEQLHIALQIIRATVSTATDEALHESVRELPSKPRMGDWAARWLDKLDQPVVPAPFQGDPDFVQLFGAELERTGIRFRNCLKQRKLHAAVGRQAYFQFLQPPGGIVELTRLSDGRWVATELAGPANGELTAENLIAIQQKLEQHAIPSFGAAIPSHMVRSVARLFQVWDLMDEIPLLDPPEMIAEVDAGMAV